MNTRAVFLSLIVAAVLPAAFAMEYFVYFGTFTEGSSGGIYVSRMDADAGRLSPPALAVAAFSPNFLAVSPDGRLVFAATRSEKPEGSVCVFRIEPGTGKLQLHDRKPSGGAGPCHVSVDASGQTLLVANYTSGSVKSFHINSDGNLTEGTFIQHEGRSVNPSRQEGPHAHCIVPAPAGLFALACDLGTDKVMIYRVDPTDATLTANEPAFGVVPPGSGPRQLVFSPDGNSAYVVNEMTCTVTAFAWDAVTGRLNPIQTTPLLAPGVEVTNAFSAAAIEVSADGRFVYATVRGHDSISVLAVDEASGGLSLVENVPSGGRVPRGMGIDPTGRWLVVGNQRSDSVAVFGINVATGRLTPTERGVSVPVAVDVKFVPIAK